MHQRLPKIPKDTSLLITVALYDGKEEQGHSAVLMEIVIFDFATHALIINIQK